MKLLFVYSIDQASFPGSAAISTMGLQFGISYLSAIAKSAGHECRLVLLVSSDWELSNQLVEDGLAKFHPDIVAYTAVATQYGSIKQMAAEIRKKMPGVFQIIGGPHVSLNPEGVLDGPFDTLCVGEGDEAFGELLDRLSAGDSISDIRNLWSRNAKGEISRNPTRPFLQDLDSLPFPDRDIWEPWMYQRAYNTQAVLLARGCPYGCTYCSNHALHRLAPGKYVRFRSPENIVEEIQCVLDRYPETPEVFFEVEAIALDQKWFFEFTGKLAEFAEKTGHKLKYSCNFRVSKQSVSDDVFLALSRANIRTINIGLEAGSERVRQDILKRNYSNDEFIEAIRLADKHNIRYNIFNMIGLPTETRKEHQETVELNRLINPANSFTSIFHPYPGTDLYSQCEKLGMLSQGIDGRGERRKAKLGMPQFSRWQIQMAYYLFRFRIYKGHRPLNERLQMVLCTVFATETVHDLLYKWRYFLGSKARRIMARLRGRQRSRAVV